MPCLLSSKRSTHGLQVVHVTDRNDSPPAAILLSARLPSHADRRRLSFCPHGLLYIVTFVRTRSHCRRQADGPILVQWQLCVRRDGAKTAARSEYGTDAELYH